MIAVALLTGCAAPRLDTTSGKPEVKIYAPREKVEERITADLVNHGFLPIAADKLGLTFERAGTISENIFFGSQFNPTTHVRVRIVILPVADATRVIYHSSVVSNPGSAFGSENELSGDWKRVQWWLECVAADLEARHRPDPLPPSPAARSPKNS